MRNHEIIVLKKKKTTVVYIIKTIQNNLFQLLDVEYLSRSFTGDWAVNRKIYRNVRTISLIVLVRYYCVRSMTTSPYPTNDINRP